MSLRLSGRTDLRFPFACVQVCSRATSRFCAPGVPPREFPLRKMLTDALVRAVPAPAAGRVEITDERSQGLTFRVTPAGVRSWTFRFRDPASGALSRATLGRYPDLSLADARNKADELRRAVVRGLNPVQEMRRARSEAATRSFEAVAERYLAEYARRRKRSASLDERNLRKHVLPTFGNRRIDQIERGDVIVLLETLVAAGTPTLANRVQSVISAVYSFAIDADLARMNPCARLRRRGVERVGERVLSDDELRLFWARVVQKPVSRRLGLSLQLQLLTGVRPVEVAAMRRDEIEHLDDPARAGWLVPASRMKGKRPHFVPLSELAISIVRDALASVPPESPFVFASPRAKGAIRANAMPIAMQRLAAALKGSEQGIETWKAEPPTPHDLRRTVATRLAGLGIRAEDVSAVLAHASSGVTKAHYDKYDRSPEKRRADGLGEFPSRYPVRFGES